VSLELQVGPRCAWGLAVREAWARKTLSRTMMNHEIRRCVRLSGRVLDLGAGDRPSYWRFTKKPDALVRVDIDRQARPDVVASLERQLPLADGVFDAVLAFNVFEHIYAGEHLASEVHRVLKPAGRLYCSVPFLVPIHADPYDFFRYTNTALSRLFDGAGFVQIQVTAYGGYFAALAEHVNRFNGIPPLRSMVVGSCLAGERILDAWLGRRENAGRFVLGYFCEAVRP
jgi:SAM-dependent methyltransferase